MLVLGRRCEQRIIIGEGADQITLVIVDIRGDRVRIGIDAPRHIAVHREEVFDRIMAERPEGGAA
jgi:carbon storage regulator